MATVEFDMSAIAAWADNVKNMLESEVDDFLLEAGGLVGSEFVQRVQQRTPIGEYGSHVEFKTSPREKSKEVSFTTKDGKHVFFIAKNPPKTVKFKSSLDGKQGGELMSAWAIKGLEHTSDGIKVIIHNPLDYAPHVEYGHIIRNKKDGEAKGFVRGKHMMKNTEIEMAFEAPRLLEEKYNEFLTRILE